MQDYRDFLDEILISEEQISQDYQDQDPHLICILRGGILFLTDLMRHIRVPNTIDFMAVSSYGVERQSTGQVRITLDLKDDIQDRNVLLVEDIIDSGYTIASVLSFLNMRHPKSLKVCALLDKPDRREVEVPIHYLGFSIPDKFVFGYGLDMDEYYRNLPFIATVDLDRYKPD